MIETRAYKCEYCGAEFDDEYEASCHEWVCRYKDVSQRKGSCLGFYRKDGAEIKFDAQAVYDWVCAECYSHLDRSVLSYLKARFKKRIDASNEAKERYYQEYLKKCQEIDGKKQKDDEMLSYLMSVNSITKIKPEMVGYGYENAVLNEALKKLKNNA